MIIAVLIVSGIAVFAGISAFGKYIEQKTVQPSGDKLSLTKDAGREAFSEGLGTEDAGRDITPEYDLRLCEYDFVNTGSSFEPGGYIDVRISFPNGVDCTILSHKKIEGIIDGKLLLAVSEDEIMRMTSARIDVRRYADCSVYVTGYAGHGLKESVCNYPVNKEVYKACAWNPNTSEKSEADGVLGYVVKRGELEKGLEAYVINE